MNLTPKFHEDYPGQKFSHTLKYSKISMYPAWFFNRFSLLLLRCLYVLCISIPGSLDRTFALEVPQDEQKTIKACEQKLCTTILGRNSEGEDLKCNLSKTWDRNSIKKGETKSIEWGFGDARCSMNLFLRRTDILSALTSKEFIAKIPPHSIQCIVEYNGAENPISAKVAPKLVFKDGKAEKIWINLSDLEGPTAITSFIWMTTQLEDKLGIFHRSIIKSVNKFITQKCAQNYFADGTPKSRSKPP